jgi:hypothetical protein
MVLSESGFNATMTIQNINTITLIITVLTYLINAFEDLEQHTLHSILSSSSFCWGDCLMSIISCVFGGSVSVILYNMTDNIFIAPIIYLIRNAIIYSLYFGE